MATTTPLPTPARRAASHRAARVRLADRLAALGFTTVALIGLVVIVAIVGFVFSEAWPSFAHNGLSWFGDSKTGLETQFGDAFTNGNRTLHAWPAILGTLLTTGGALLLAFPFSLLAAIFIADLAPAWLARILDPIVSLLAGTPSVIFGLFALLAVAPLIQDHLVDPDVAADYAPIVSIGGASVLLGIIVLSVMIAPIMIAIFTDALRAVPRAWSEGAIALGCDRWRATRRVSLAAIGPALVAGTGLAIGRAVGEAIALSMAAGTVAFTPNPLDGVNFFFEPVHPLASMIVDYSTGTEASALRADLFAFGAVLLVSTAALTLAARAIAAPLERRLRGDLAKPSRRRAWSAAEIAPAHPAIEAPPLQQLGPARNAPRSTRRLSDRAGIVAAWGTGLALAAVVILLLGWITVNGIRNVDWAFLVRSPGAGSLESGVTGGILDPLMGTLIVVVLGIAVAFPLGVGTAVFLAEYRRPSWLGRLVDSSVDMIFGVPSIVFALFGLAAFHPASVVFLSNRIESSGLATAVSFLVASLMLAMIAYPPIVRATESAISSVPTRQREASFALGKGKLTTVRRIVLPGARPGIVTGVILGIGRIVGDTAIAVVLLGGTVLGALPHGWWHLDSILDTLRGQGATLTSYIYYASPAGDGNTAPKAYGAAFVLMIGILVVNGLVRLVGRRRSA